MEVNTSKTQLVRQQGPNPVPGQATSVATVAIQSGQSRIVIAVLRVSLTVAENTMFQRKIVNNVLSF